MSKVIKLDHITKIEGHASLHIKVEKGTIVKCELGAIEGSRYFEGLLRGRYYTEAPEITSRICGICSCAHTLCSIKAMEQALNIIPSQQTNALRELMMIGERIRSHATHLYFLALPDYLSYDSALEMVPYRKKDITRALQLIKLGNDMLRLIAGREMHPVSAQIGGFLKIPDKKAVPEIRKALEKSKKDAEITAQLFSKIKYPKFESKTEYFSLCTGKSYPLMYGNLKSGNSSFQVYEFGSYLREYHEPYTTSNFVVKKGKAYMVGALARMNNNVKFLSKNTQKLLKKSKIQFPNYNPFINNYCQALELVHYIDYALDVCKKLRLREEKPLEIKPVQGHGIAAIEVPRGILWHEYEINESGKIEMANIITPTCQNLLNMENDIREYLPHVIHKKKEQIVLEIEKLIRSYDPCFSCSTHFLDVSWEEKS